MQPRPDMAIRCIRSGRAEAKRWLREDELVQNPEVRSPGLLASPKSMRSKSGWGRDDAPADEDL